MEMEGKEGAGIRAKASMVFSFSDDKSAIAAVKSLKGEGAIGKRCRSEVSREGKSVRISLDADDIVCLRATANGFLRALQVFESVENNISEGR